MPIQLLSPEIASQIAAGEVVERPASVVKELIENSIDAGASHIVIKVEGAGKNLIEVADNGFGIPAAELALSVERHATSKISSSKDLTHISTLGFRGEALASIGSISHLTVTSRWIDEPIGALLKVDGGFLSQVVPIGAPVGTTMRVEDLFFNVPARKKFLKQDLTERRHIEILVGRYALSFPNKRFLLVQDDRKSIQTTGNGNSREVLTVIYGFEIARNLIELNYQAEDISIFGFLSPVSISRANRQELHFYVNGRPVQDATLATALLKGYHTLLMTGRYPIVSLMLTIPPDLVDVNVHPTKAEVRFSNPDRIFTMVQSAVRRTLLAHSPVPGIPFQVGWKPTDETRPEQPNQFDLKTSPWKGLERASAAHSPEDAQQQGNEAARSNQRLFQIPILRLIGQIANTYLVAEGPDGLYLIDQHAAHERVLFENLLSNRSIQPVSQTLLQPEVIELAPHQARLLNEQLPVLAKFGFNVEPFGTNAFLVRSIPGILAGSSPSAALRSLVEDFEEDETPLKNQIDARLIARICKRSAIKGGQSLSVEEQKSLLTALEACESPRTCPHGRPTMIHLSVDLLERQFGRKGPR